MDLEKIAPIIQQVLIQSLQEKRYPFGFSKYKGLSDKVASGKLRNSIKVNVVQKPNHSGIIEVLAEQYAQWVQSGRLPGKKGVPISAIENWIKSRGIKGRNKKGQFITNRSFAFAIQNNIKKFGIRPSNFLDVALETIGNDPKIMELLGDEAYEELINLIEGI